MFSQVKRTTYDIKNHSETDWEYLDRSGRPEAQRVRDLLTSWLSSYPAEHRPDLVSRMCGRDNTAFQAATFELLLYSALSWLGCSIEVHPALTTNRKRPDFLITSPVGDRAYVEAVSASEFSSEAKAAKQRTKVVLDALEKVNSPDFYITVDTDGDPKKPPNVGRLCDELQRWVFSLDYKAVVAGVVERGYDAYPKLLWKQDNWKISFDAIPKEEGRRRQGERTIHAIVENARWVANEKPIRNAIKSKGNRYGELPHPLLIAINTDAMSVDRIDEVAALFGDEVYTFCKSNPAESEMRRAPNGAWRSRSGPQYTRVSGAWIFRGAPTSNIASRIQTVYFHPYAARPLPAVFDVLPHAKVDRGILKWTGGISIREMFGLSDGWPGS